MVYYSTDFYYMNFAVIHVCGLLSWKIDYPSEFSTVWKDCEKKQGSYIMRWVFTIFLVNYLYEPFMVYGV